jgi:hypothetical protein
MTERPIGGTPLADIRARLAAVTPGPWSAADEHGLLPGAGPAWCVSRMRPGYESMSPEDGYMYDIADLGDYDRAEADAEFIAHAPEDIRFLLNEVDRLTVELRTRRSLDAPFNDR